MLFMLQQRHINDNEVNKKRFAHVIRERQLVKEQWNRVVVGDIIKLHKNDAVVVSITHTQGSKTHSCIL